MRLRAIDIQQLPGTGAFRVDGLAPGTNLVTGPNAVGKSSLIRALQYLIGGARSSDPHALALSAEFDDGTHRWQVRRAGSQITWTCDGQVSAPPALPDRDRLHCYWLQVEDLLSADPHDDAALLRQLRNELSGGFDLDALRRTAPFNFGPQTGRNEARALQEARRSRREVENQQQSLRSEAERLPAMRADADAAERASRRVERLDRALSLLEARRERRDAEQRLTRFPPDMDRLRGNELTRLAELESERERCLQQHAEQQRGLDAAAARLRETGLSEERPTAAAFQAQHERRAQRTRLADQLEHERARIREARAQEKRAAQALGATRALPRLSPDSVERAGELAGRMQQARRTRDEAAARYSALDQEEDATRHARGSASALAIATLALLGGLGASASSVWLPSPWWHLAAAAGLAGAGFWGLIESGRRWAHRRRAAATRALRRQERAAELEQAQAQVDAVEDERRAFCAEHGIDPGLFDGAALDRFIRLAVDLDRARDARYAAEQTAADTEARLAQEDRRMHAFVTRWGAAPAATDGPELHAALAALEQRCADAAEAERDQREAEQEIVRLEQSLGNADERIAQLYREAGLEPGARAELEARCAAFDEWQQARQAHERCANVEADRRRRLADAPELVARVEADAEAELQQEREQAAQQAHDRDRLRDAVRDLEQRLHRAGQETELEDAAAAEARAREALAEQFDQAMLAAAGHHLLDAVAADYRNDHEPAILQDAQARFARFTHHAWSLEVDPAVGFHAIERASEEPRGLEQLSSGTRMQLLLAVRMAWARQIERERTPLPLFLDEALTTSDEARFGQVAASLQQLADEEDRQIVYLSARRQEAALWEQACGQRPELIDLAVVRFGAGSAGADDYALPPAEAVPEPEGHTPAQYAARLGVPPVDPRQSAAAIHVFHLLRDDLAALHRLMEHWRVTQLGALESLLASEVAATALPSAPLRAALAARCAAAREWTAVWREGRGRPVDRGVLETSEAVGAAFIDRIAEQSHAVGGDPEALIAALRAGAVDRFGKTRTDRLEQWLHSHGYIDGAEPPNAEERERRTLWSAGSGGDPADLRALLHWLEAGMDRHPAPATAETSAGIPA